MSSGRTQLKGIENGRKMILIKLRLIKIVSNTHIWYTYYFKDKPIEKVPLWGITRWFPSRVAIEKIW